MVFVWTTFFIKKISLLISAIFDCTHFDFINTASIKFYEYFWEVQLKILIVLLIRTKATFSLLLWYWSWYLDHNSEIAAHVRSNWYFSICLRHLIFLIAVTNLIFFSKKTYFPPCVRSLFCVTIFYWYHDTDMTFNLSLYPCSIFGLYR